ncbi:unnamed protein product [Chironomus riparius]|uniref:Uncharacterized protein n=1 Tax=Chironomus riparius TaxID=315576 RepID=A0A9N9RUZ5_9DIPT|nr:unnamed protein product [Chironomus riparius]
MKSLVVLIFIFYLISYADLKTIAMKNSDTGCIARYLLNNNVISASDVKNFVIDDSAENCVEKINLANKEFFRQLSKKSTGDKKMDSCIIRTLERNNVTNLIFKEILMYHVKSGKEFQVLKDLKTIKKRFFETAELVCKHQDIFAPNINEKFDNLAMNNVDINDIYEFNEIKYCVQKFIVNNEVVKIDQNRVDIEPKNIDQEDLDELDCKEVVDDLYNTMDKDIEEILETSSSSQYVKTSCLVKKALDFNFLEKMFSYVFLIHSNLSKENKSLVRKRADETEPSVERYMMECIHLY